MLYLFERCQYSKEEEAAALCHSIFLGVQGNSEAAQALDLHTDGKEHLNPPHSVWHGHGRILLLLVAVHLAAFLYWCVDNPLCQPRCLPALSKLGRSAQRVLSC